MITRNLDKFAILGRKILAAGINYKSLVKKLNLPMPDKPMVFSKPPSSYITEGQKIWIPEGCIVTQEVELGIVIGKNGRLISAKDALKHVGGYCLALDMCASNLFNHARKTGGPWDLSKGFDTACPVSKLIQPKLIKNPNNLELWSAVNGSEKQRENTKDLIFSVEQLIELCSFYMTLEPNDMILTGSSPGNCEVKTGDVIEAGIKDFITIKFEVGPNK